MKVMLKLMANAKTEKEIKKEKQEEEEKKRKTTTTTTSCGEKDTVR